MAGDDDSGGARVEKGVPLYSYRPALPASSLPSSATVTVALAVSAGTDKVLPNGLRSPSAITDLDAMQLDDTGLSTDSSASARVNSSGTLGAARDREAASSITRPSRPVWLQPREKMREGHEAGDEAAPPDSDGGSAFAGSATSQGNAPFRALQFVPPSPTDPIASPPLSGRDGPPLDVPTQPSRGASAEQKRRAPTAEFAAAPEAASSPVTGSKDELPSLMVCPLALVGCCPTGTHRGNELYSGVVQHQHLLAMVKCVQRMRGRQQELEQRVLGLQEQLSGQAAALRETQQALRRALQRSHGCPSTTESTAVSESDDEHDNVERREGGSKALPRDVSIREPHCADYDFDMGDAAAAATAEHRASGMYARQLRRRTATAAAAATEATSPAPRSSAASAAPAADVSRSGNGKQLPSGSRGSASSTPTDARGTRPVASAQLLRRQAAPQRAAAVKRVTVSTDNEWKSGRQVGAVAGGDALSVSADAGQRVTGSAASAHPPRLDDHKRLPPSPTASRLHGGSSTEPAGTDSRSSSVRCGGSGRHRRLVSPHPRPGACGSTEVSGMSSVPPYQPPNESMSPISSASLDLNDHEDDTDDGAMHRQLLCLTPSGRPVALALQTYRAPATQLRALAEGGVAAVASARSVPSLVSVTFRPSELAQAQRAAMMVAGPSTRTPECESPLPAPRLCLAQELEECGARTAAPASVVQDGVRLAAPLQRPTVVSKRDVVPVAAPPPGRLTSSEVSGVVLLPRAVATAALCHAAAAGTAADACATRGILDRSHAKRPRRISAPDSDGRRVPLSGICLDTSSTASPLGGPDAAAVPLLASVTAPTHAHSYHGDDGAADADAPGRRIAEGEEAAEKANVTAAPRVRRRSGSKTRRDNAAAHRPAHATSLLSTHEAREQGVAVRPLGLPPRRAP